MAERIKEVAVEEAEHIKTVARDAARSGAYLYPVRVSDISTSDPLLFIVKPAWLLRELFKWKVANHGSQGISTSSPTAACGNPSFPSSPPP